MEVVLVLGRILLVTLVVLSALTFHFTTAARDLARQSGAPAPDLLVPLSGVVMIIGGLMVALGLWADLGALIVIATLLPISFIMHAFWKLEGMQRIDQQTHFLKNIGIIGGLVIVFWLYNQGQDVDASLTDALFGRW